MKPINFTLLLFCFSSPLLIAQDFTQSPFQDISVNVYAVADYDGDGYADIFGVDAKFNAPSEIMLFLNDAPNADSIAFQKTVLWEEHEASCNPDAGDYDGDGDMDVVIANGDSLGLAILQNNGNATFEEIPLNVAGAFTLEFHDLDYDGDLDIVGMIESEDILNIFVNDGSQNFTKTNIVTSDDDLKSFSVGDLDGDNDLDLILGYSEVFDDQVVVMKNDGNNLFEPTVLESGTYGFQNLSQIAIGDLNRDGQMDVAATNRTNFTGWINKGGFTFERQELVDYSGTSFFGFLNLTLADFTGEGVLDAVMGDNDGPIVWYKNTSIDPLAYEKGEVGSVAPAREFATADFDLDGDVDIVTSNGEFWWYENNIEQEPNAIQIAEGISFELLPNPFQNQLFIKGIPEGKYRYVLSDLSGRSVANGLASQAPLDVSMLYPGSYFLTLVDMFSYERATAHVIKLK